MRLVPEAITSEALGWELIVPFDARVIRVLVASPGDTVKEREVCRRVIDDWNSMHAEQGVVLLPLTWEQDATPEMGDRPQGVLNRQLVDRADMLVGIFWTRLGTPTGEADSGTVEEIHECLDADKPVLLYFSDTPVVPGSIDLDQYARLREAREDFESRGLVDSFENEHDLYRLLIADLTRTVRSRFAPSLRELEVSPSDPPSEASLRALILARIEREREISGFSSSGSPRYRTRERLVIENHGDATAEDLTWSVEVAEGENKPTIGRDDDRPIGHFPPRAAIDYPMMRTFGTASSWDLVFRWREGESEHETRQTMAG